MNRLSIALSAASQEFADAAHAVPPLTRSLSAVASSTLENRRRATYLELLALQARAHGVSMPPEETAFTPVSGSTAAWSEEDWSHFSPVGASLSVPRLTRVGTFKRTVAMAGAPVTLPIEFPALVPIIGRGGLAILAEGKEIDAARDVLESICVRLITALPPGLVRLTLVDHVGVGNNFALLTPFHEVIRGPMVWHDGKQIGKALDTLIDSMANVTQKYLKTKYGDIEEYNRDQGVVEEPYRVLAIANFPAGFNESSAQQVISIAQNGPRSGMYVILSIDRKAPMPHGFNLNDLTRFCTVLEGTMTGDFAWKPNPHRVADGAVRWVTDVLQRGRIELDGAPDKTIVEAIAEATAGLAADKQSVKVSFDRFVPTKLWHSKDKNGNLVENTTANGISVPIGRRGSEDQLFEFSRGADSAHHAIIGGRTGSGKSVLMKGLITSLCMHYSPEELELYLIDFKGGVEFRVFSGLRHARVVAIDSEREFGVSVLDALLKEKLEREREFKKKGVVNLTEYRATGARMPRILLIVDEFQVFFETNDRLANRARAALTDLARLGRGFGIHVILASQSISTSSGAELDSAALNQFGMRIALSMSETDSYKILSKENDAAKYLNRAGEAIFNARNGLVEGNSKFQVANITDGEVDERLHTINDEAQRQGIGRLPRLFEGNRPATLHDNAHLIDALRNGPPAGLRYLPLYLGEPAQITDDHTYFRMRRQSSDNLLMVGQHDETLFPIFTTAVASWSVNQPSRSARLYVMNLANVDDPVAEQFDIFRELPQTVRVVRNRDVVAVVDEVAALLEARLPESDAGGRETPHEPVLLAFYGLQRARDLVRDGVNPKAATKKLTRIIHDGPEAGVWVIVAADTHANLLRVLENKDLNDFSGRVAVVGSDSGKILGEHSGAFKVREQYGVLYEMDKPDMLQKFRTYGIEQIELLRQELS
jgi:hypothetical protein